jgi:hypothetical protein
LLTIAVGDEQAVGGAGDDDAAPMVHPVVIRTHQDQVVEKYLIYLHPTS